MMTVVVYLIKGAKTAVDYFCSQRSLKNAVRKEKLKGKSLNLNLNLNLGRSLRVNLRLKRRRRTKSRRTH